MFAAGSVVADAVWSGSGQGRDFLLFWRGRTLFEPGQLILYISVGWCCLCGVINASTEEARVRPVRTRRPLLAKVDGELLHHGQAARRRTPDYLVRADRQLKIQLTHDGKNLASSPSSIMIQPATCDVEAIAMQYNRAKLSLSSACLTASCTSHRGDHETNDIQPMCPRDGMHPRVCVRLHRQTACAVVYSGLLETEYYMSAFSSVAMEFSCCRASGGLCNKQAELHVITTLSPK